MLRYTRFFLTREADSYVRLEVPSEYDHSYSLKMADCSRTINWSFYCQTRAQRRNSLNKLKKFRDLINQLYDELEAGLK